MHLSSKVFDFLPRCQKSGNFGRFFLPGACMDGQDCGWHGVCITYCGQRRCSPGAVPKMLKYFSKAADVNTGGVHENE